MAGMTFGARPLPTLMPTSCWTILSASWSRKSKSLNVGGRKTSSCESTWQPEAPFVDTCCDWSRPISVTGACVGTSPTPSTALEDEAHSARKTAFFRRISRNKHRSLSRLNAAFSSWASLICWSKSNSFSSDVLAAVSSAPTLAPTVTSSSSTSWNSTPPASNFR